MGEAQDEMRGTRGDTKGLYDMKGPTGPFPLVFTHDARASPPSFRRRPESMGVDGASSGYGQGSTGVRAPSPWDPVFAGKTEVVGCGLAIGRRLIFITSCGIRKAIVIPSPSCLSF